MTDITYITEIDHDSHDARVETRDKMAEALNRVAYGGERVILEVRGKGVAAPFPRRPGIAGEAGGRSRRSGPSNGPGRK